MNSKTLNTSPCRLSDMFEFEALTDNQQKARDAWEEDHHLVLSGSAGTPVRHILECISLLKKF